MVRFGLMPHGQTTANFPVGSMQLRPALRLSRSLVNPNPGLPLPLSRAVLLINVALSLLPPPNPHMERAKLFSIHAPPEFVPYCEWRSVSTPSAEFKATLPKKRLLFPESLNATSAPSTILFSIILSFAKYITVESLGPKRDASAGLV